MVGAGIVLDDLESAVVGQGHGAHLDPDLGRDRIIPGALEHAAALDARHHLLEVEKVGVQVVDRLRGGEGVVELDGHDEDYRVRAMPIPRGTHTLGPSTGTLAVRTGRTGAAAKAGHDLLLHVTEWQATLEVADDSTPAAISLDADGGSLRVREGTGGMQALDDDDKANVEQTIDDDVLKRQRITYRSSS